MKILAKNATNTAYGLIRLKPSKVFLGMILIMHLVAVIAVLSSHLPVLFEPLIAKQVLIIILLVHAGYYTHTWRASNQYTFQNLNQKWQLIEFVAAKKVLKRNNLSQGQPIQEQSLNNKIELCLKKQYTVQHCYYWSRWLLILLVVDTTGQRMHFPIIFDGCSKEDFRQLRVISKTVNFGQSSTLY